MTRAELKDLIRPVARDMQAFDRKQQRCLAAESNLIRAVVSHIMASRGKRLRPAMLFLAARGAGFYAPRLVEAALSIELIHTATLLHDDVVDESEVRRGKATVNYRWNNLVSVLMGDFLFSKAFRIMMATGSPELTSAISRATERVSFGELRQIEETANFALPELDYIRIISDKTASLFAVACEAGSIMARASSPKRRRWREFGENVGIAFQITDDLLDYVGDSRKTGKGLGSDLLQGKVTLPLIHSLNRSSAKARREMETYLGNGVGKRGITRVIRFINDQGGIEYAYGVARSYSDRAADALGTLADNIYGRTLRDLVSFAVSRDN